MLAKTGLHDHRTDGEACSRSGDSGRPGAPDVLRQRLDENRGVGRVQRVAPGTMTLAELQAFLAHNRGEWEHLEFKKTTGELHGGMETLCGFLNGSGGKVIF